VSINSDRATIGAHQLFTWSPASVQLHGYSIGARSACVCVDVFCHRWQKPWPIVDMLWRTHLTRSN